MQARVQSKTLRRANCLNNNKLYIHVLLFMRLLNTHSSIKLFKITQYTVFFNY